MYCRTMECEENVVLMPFEENVGIVGCRDSGPSFGLMLRMSECCVGIMGCRNNGSLIITSKNSVVDIM